MRKLGFILALMTVVFAVLEKLCEEVFDLEILFLLVLQKLDDIKLNISIRPFCDAMVIIFKQLRTCCIKLKTNVCDLLFSKETPMLSILID